MIQQICSKNTSAFCYQQMAEIQRSLENRLLNFTQEQISNQIEDYILKSILSQQKNQLKYLEVKNCNSSQQASYQDLMNCSVRALEKLQTQKQQMRQQYQAKILEMLSKKNQQVQNLNQKIINLDQTFKVKWNVMARQIEVLKYQKSKIVLEKQQQLASSQKKINQLQKKLSIFKMNLQKSEYQKSQQQLPNQGLKELQQMQKIVKMENQYLVNRLNQLELYNILKFEIEEFHDAQRVKKTSELLQKQRQMIFVMGKLQILIHQTPNYQILDTNISQIRSQCIEDKYQLLKSIQKQYEDLTQAQIKKLLTQIKQLKNISHSLKKQLSYERQSSVSLASIKEKQISSLSRQITLLNKQISILKVQLKDSANQNQSLKKRVKQANEQFSKQNTHTEQLSKELKIAKQQRQNLEKIKQQSNRMNSQNQNLLIQISSLRETIETIRNVRQSQNHEKQIVDQMIQKSYLTRIQNKQQKEQIKILKNQIQGSQQLIKELKYTLQTYRLKNQELQITLGQLQQQMKTRIEKVTMKQLVTKKLILQSVQNVQSDFYQNQSLINQQENLLKNQTYENDGEDDKDNDNSKSEQKYFDSSIHSKPKANQSSICSECSDSESVIQCKCHPRRPLQTQKQKQNQDKSNGVPFQTSFHKTRQIKKHPILKKLETMTYTEQKKLEKKHEKKDTINTVEQFDENKENIINSQRCSNSQMNTKRQIQRTSNLNDNNSKQSIKEPEYQSSATSVNQTQRYKYKVPEKQRAQFIQKELERYKKNMSDMNEIINYIVNYIKGYTRNGIRSKCWIASQGQKYLKKALMTENVKIKYQNFEKIRALCNEDRNCRQLVKNFEIIMNFYFQ